MNRHLALLLGFALLVAGCHKQSGTEKGPNLNSPAATASSRASAPAKAAGAEKPDKVKRLNQDGTESVARTRWSVVDDYWRSSREIRLRLAKLLPDLPKADGGAWLKKEWWFYATLAEANFGLAQFDAAIADRVEVRRELPETTLLVVGHVVPGLIHHVANGIRFRRFVQPSREERVQLKEEARALHEGGGSRWLLQRRSGIHAWEVSVP